MLLTDPPYYDAVPYAYLSDYFYVWLRRTLANVHPDLLRDAGVPVRQEPVDQPWGERNAYVEDPEGNPVHIASPVRST